MRLLLDTQAFLWWMANSSRLTREARAEISDPQNQVLFSIASAWEISIKRSLGKLRAPENLAEALASESFDLLGIGLAHIEALDRLDHHHRDPFDRILIAQAGVERVKLVSGDAIFRRYGVDILW
ncbi:MAG TPA: type II toxin-antitoxin system VapC family toxin [Stellaceae bacterium]|nr:type II toxin-antitoxin system VapC family toxin [Stellaceae bacterium]